MNVIRTIQATAPGKVIIFGEHAVVYGRPAVAVPVTQVRAQATILPAEPGAGFRMVAPDLARDYLLPEAGMDDPLVMMVQSTLSYLKQSSPPDVTLRVTSTIPIGRGLGSGAAISTAIVRVLADWFEQPLLPAEISSLVYEVEKLYHGTPSGIDNTVVAFEQPVYFVKGTLLQRMPVARPFHLVVGDTGVTSPTHAVVGDLRRRRETDPERYDGYFDEIGTIADQAKIIIEQGVSDLPALGKLMNENQELLEALDVSSPGLARLIEAAREAGAWGAKLSGAGRGGNMIALTPPEAMARVAQTLTEAGAAGVIVTEVS